MKTSGKVVLSTVAAFLAIQFVRPSIPTAPPRAEVQAPPEVRRILEKSCYSCHSDERRLAWFDQIAPAYWLVRYDVLTAREHLDFSTLGAKPPAAQRGMLFEAANFIELGAMPLPRFTAAHPAAKVSDQDLATLKAYLAPWKTPPPASFDPAHASSTQPSPALASLAAVKPALNGIPFDPTFVDWKPISFSDRGDNNTLRFILGNDIAIRAAQSGNISPWPNGTRFAKIAWQQTLGPDGLVHPGKFIQVELMIKDSRQYKSTDGWGWARWVGLDLKPYGKDARFLNECTGCHLPVRGDDYFYTLPVTTAQVAHAEIVNNRAAALPAALPYQPLSWQPITMYVDPSTRTMATLFGNATAIEEIRAPGTTNSSAPHLPYREGAVLALVTWAQREDPHWFGARIPDRIQSVEFVQIGKEGAPAAYSRFSGNRQDQSPPSLAAQRTNLILSLSPAQLS